MDESDSLHWAPVPFAPAYLNRILALRNRMFSLIEGEYDGATYRWKHLEGPEGGSCVSLAVDKTDPERVAAHYAMLPRQIRLGDSVFSSSQPVDVFVDDTYAYRREGVFLRLAEMVHERERQGGRKFFFGFPNATSYPVFSGLLRFRSALKLYPYQVPLKVGFFTRRIPLMKVAGGLGPIGRLRLPRLTPLVRSQGYDVNEVREAGEGWTEFFEAASKQFPISMIRNRAYVQWRYFSCPTKNYRVFEVRRAGRMVGLFVVALIVKNEFASTAQCVDFLALDETSWKATTRLMFSTLQNTDAESCVTLLHPENPVTPLFESLGFVRRKNMGHHFIVRNFTEPAEKVDCFDPKNWFLTPGDGDSF